MGRELALDLRSAHKDVLEQFRAGHVTAGQLTERLERLDRPIADAPTAAMAAVAPARRMRHRLARLVSLAALVTVGTAGGMVVGIEIGSQAQPVAAQTPPAVHVNH